MIEKESLKTVLKEIEDEIMTDVYRADRNAKNYSATEFYCSDQKGYNRGMYMATQKIVKVLSDKFRL